MNKQQKFALPLLLAHEYADTNPSGWWMSEKLDGVRAYWDGKNFLSRQGNVFVAPEWFTRGLPSTPLDGELWGGRGAFQMTLGIVRTQNGKRDEEWRKIAYVVFDAPAAPGTFEQRQDAARAAIEGAERAMLLEQEVCAGAAHLAAELARVESLNGEGLMLRKPKSLYETRRSRTLLKVKTFHDAEAEVIGHLPGEGRNAHRLGALRCRLANGTIFKVGGGLIDAERDAPPTIGTAITFKHQGFSDDGKPRFGTFVRIHVAV